MSSSEAIDGFEKIIQRAKLEQENFLRAPRFQLDKLNFHQWRFAEKLDQKIHKHILGREGQPVSCAMLYKAFRFS